MTIIFEMAIKKCVNFFRLFHFTNIANIDEVIFTNSQFSAMMVNSSIVFMLLIYLTDKYYIHIASTNTSFKLDNQKSHYMLASVLKTRITRNDVYETLCPNPLLVKKG